MEHTLLFDAQDCHIQQIKAFFGWKFISQRLAEISDMSSLLQRLRSSILFKNFLALSVVQIATTLLPLLTVPYLLRILSTDGYGLSAYAQSFAAYFNVILEYGFFLTATRAVSTVKHDRGALSGVVSRVIWTKVLLGTVSAVVFFGLVISVPGLRSQRLPLLIAMMTVVATSSVPTWLYQGTERLSELAWLTLASRLIQVPLMFLLIRSNRDVVVWLWLQFGIAILMAIIVWVRTVPKLIDLPRWPGWIGVHQSLREGATIFGSQLSVSLYTVGNTFVLGQLADLHTAGLFAAAERVVRMAFGMLGPIHQALFPRSSELVQTDPKAALRLARTALYINAGLGTLVGIVVFLTAPWIQSVLLGPDFVDVVGLLCLMSILPLLFALGATLTLQIVVPFRFDKGLLLIYLGAGILNLAIVFVFSSAFKANAMAVAVICAELFVVVAQVVLIRRKGIRLLRW